MSNSSHKERYFTKLLIGFASLIGSVLVTFYAIFELKRDSDWYYWAIFAAFLLCGGIYFCLHAFVHKIKSEFARRQQQRDRQKSAATTA
jgi:hypothetical protein